MKLATIKDGSRDGYLVVVSRDLTRCVSAEMIAPTLQAALDDWPRLAHKLDGLAEQLEHGSVPFERFHERHCLSPLPRAYQWADGSAYVNHVELVRKARGAEMPASFWTDPLMYQGGSDAFLSPREPIRVADETYGIDFEGEVAVIVDDVPMGASRERLPSRLPGSAGGGISTPVVPVWPISKISGSSSIRARLPVNVVGVAASLAFISGRQPPWLIVMTAVPRARMRRLRRPPA